MKKTVHLLLSLFIVLSIFAGCSSSQTADDIQPSVSGVIEAIYPVDTTVDFHTKKQATYLEKPYSSIPISVNGKKEQSRPDAVEFSWAFDEGQGDAVVEYIFSISENEDMSDAISYSTSVKHTSVYNLKIAATYYWTVSVNGKTSEVSKFTTASIPPRNMYVDGITNVRDLGGWETENGTRTKQGLIYRCGRLNESSAPFVNIEITENGIYTMRDELGVKTEIDIRKADDGEVGGITSSPLGESIAYYNCPMEWQGDTFNGNRDELLKVFEILSKEENYPVIFHCNIGTDRTGMIAYLLNALLGVPEEDLFRDYLFSNFGNIGGTRKISLLQKSAYYEAVHSSSGNSLKEKAYNCLVDFGVPGEQLDSIISILSGE